MAVAVPNALFISDALGLHPSVNDVPPVVRVGGVTSCVHVTVLDAVAVLPQPSSAVNVLVCERRQLLLDTALSVWLTNGRPPQLSVAVAVPSAAFISPADGLHPRDVPVPPVVSVGPV